MEGGSAFGLKVIHRWRAIADLYEWEIETGLALPGYAGRIVDVEMAGGVVDLLTGEVSYPDKGNHDQSFELQQHQFVPDVP